MYTVYILASIVHVYINLVLKNNSVRIARFRTLASMTYNIMMCLLYFLDAVLVADHSHYNVIKYTGWIYCNPQPFCAFYF